MALTDRLETECGRFAPQTRPFSFAICTGLEIEQPKALRMA